MEQPPRLGEPDRRRRSGGHMFRRHGLFQLIGHDFPEGTDESRQHSTHVLTGGLLPMHGSRKQLGTRLIAKIKKDLGLN